jgi:hypothetical protein
VIAAMPDGEKTGLLVQMFEGAPNVMAELRARARAIRLARERAEVDKAEAERKRQAEEAEKVRRARLDAITRRGESVWREIETEIERRNPAGYEKAAGLLFDLKAIAEESGTIEDFLRRLRTIRERHVRKGRFIERLAGLG